MSPTVRVCVRALLVLLGAAVAGVAVGVSPADAHTELVRSDPAADSSPATPPTAVRLTFSEAVQQTFATIAVTDPSGTRLETGPPTVHGRVVTTALNRPAEPGRYRVAWRVVADDGHPVDGQFSFTVTATALAAQPLTTVAPSATSASTSAETAGAATHEAAAAPDHDHDGSGGAGGFVTDHAWHFVAGALILVAGALLLWRERKIAR
jgi:methionine-rich copper-binding protein CopC